MRSWLAVLVLASSMAHGLAQDACAATTPAEQASALFASASRRLASGTHEQRQFALAELEDASRLDPSRTDIALALGGLCLEADLLSRARDVASKLVQRDSADASAWLLLGRVWRRYWLGTIDDDARDRAIVCLARSARLRPAEAEAWRLLAPILTDAEELEAAHSAAVFAARAAPRDPDAQVLLAATAQQVGDLATADRMFRAAVPCLPAKARERYEDLSPLLPPAAAASYGAMDAPGRARYAERFWADSDPDPVTEENEARLEYWARVTLATALYGMARPGEWDMRAQYYVRFGRPGYEELSPIMKPEFLRRGDWLAWTYPDLGLRVWMGTPSVIHGFAESVSGLATFAHAAPDSLARRNDLLPIFGGWAVIHRLPPGVTPLETQLALARFRSPEGLHVFAQAEAPGALDARYTAEWVVLDSMAAAVARGMLPMSASACEAEAARAAGFTAALAPGRYLVGVQVSDTLGHRGTERRGLVVEAGSGQLALSDLVVVCGSPERSTMGGSTVRLEPETGLFPAGGDQLHAYFEIYNLTAAPGGEAQFVYDCTVRPVVPDRRGWLSRLLASHAGPPPIEVSRAERTVGPVRRQFLSMPVGSLPAGRYEIAVLVRDVANGATARAVASFERGR